MAPLVSETCFCPPADQPIPPPRNSVTPERLCGLVLAMTATAFALPVRELRARSRRSANVAFARQCAMYLAHVGYGLPYAAIGAGFGRDRTTAARACRKVEECRDDPVIDALMGALEGMCDAMHGRSTGRVRP